MAKFAPLRPDQFKELYHIAMECEPFQSDMSLAKFMMVMNSREGWTVVDGTKIIGAVTYGDFAPLQDATLHVFIDKNYHGRWVTRGMLSMAFRYPFKTLRLPRISGFCVVGLSDHVGKNLLDLGFKEEGKRRNAYRLNDRYFDVKLYGMLNEECKWL